MKLSIIIGFLFVFSNLAISQESDKYYNIIDFEKWREDSLGCNDYRSENYFKISKNKDLFIGLSIDTIYSMFGPPNIKSDFEYFYSVSVIEWFCESEDRVIEFLEYLEPLYSISFHFRKGKLYQIATWIH